MFNKDTELRKLPMATLESIANILEINDGWKTVMSLIPKNIASDFFEPKYNNEHVKLIEEHAKATGKNCAEILFDEWGTSGRIRPTLTTLKDIVIKAQIFRAADEIANLLHEPLPPRPSTGPAAELDTSISILLNGESFEEKLNNMDSIKDSYFNCHKTNDYDEALCNGTTKQMKTATDLMKFSKNTVNSDELPKISALQSANEQTTTELKSESDMIKFSKTQTNSALESMNIPHFSVLLDTNASVAPDMPPSVRTDTEIGSSVTSYVSTNETIEQQKTNPSAVNPSGSPYQTSLPNISLDSEVESVILQDTNLVHFEYAVLGNITNNFSPQLYRGPNGLCGRIGSGGFGDVFVGSHPKYGALAVKKARNNHRPDLDHKVFNAEVKCLAQFRHKNIVSILGFAIDGPSLCIVCEYINGGSLQENLAAKVLNEKQRLTIMLGTAEGLKYLHRSENPLESNDILYGISESNSSKKNNFVHRDVKSANILLTRQCVPKLCDFGLAKQYDSTFITTSPMGTSAYMAPEGFSGTITQKIDIFSFGIVLLELLTGLQPIIIINNSEKINIKTYVEENIANHGVTKLLDPVVSAWTNPEAIYNLATSCLLYDRKKRPSIEEICDILHNLCN